MAQPRSCLAFFKHSAHLCDALPSLGLSPLLSLHPGRSDLTFEAPDIFSDTFSSTVHFGA